MFLGLQLNESKFLSGDSSSQVSRFIALLVFASGMSVISSDLVAQPTEIQSSEATRVDQTCKPIFTDLIKKIGHSVVNISGESDGEDTEGNPTGPLGPGKSAGSGFVLTSDGLIVTNYHVIQGTEKIVVRLGDDKKEFTGTLVGRDEKTDVALIRIDPKTNGNSPMPHLDPVVLGDSDALEVGEWVLAVGNQFQLGQTVTAGIVSAKSRRMNAQISGPYDNFIQTDASINPGSSGGPLFNTKGEVVGINTAIFSPGRSQYGSGFNIGIGFSIPMNMAKSIIGQLRDKGKVTRGMLGVIIQPIDAEMGEAMGYESLDGALVAHIVPGSPAERAGFRLKDIILSFNGSPIRDHDDLPILVASTNIGQEVVVEVLRGGEQETVTATIAELDNKAFPGLEQKEEKQIEIYNAIGLQTEAISKELADSLSIDKESGVVVTKINPGSSSERAGIQRGDIVVELANAPISDSTTLDSIAKKLEIGKPTLVLIRKKEGTRFLVIKRREKDAEVVGKDATKAN